MARKEALLQGVREPKARQRIIAKRSDATVNSAGLACARTTQDALSLSVIEHRRLKQSMQGFLSKKSIFSMRIVFVRVFFGF